MTATCLEELSDLDLDSLLEAVHHAYHYDFRRYARSFLRRRVARAASVLRALDPSHLRERVVADPAAFATLLRHLTIQVSDLFRDPPFYRCLRESVVPRLSTYPSLKVWVAGCGTGEEAYSMAILLHEAGLLERSLIYATDIDPYVLQSARAGTYDLGRLARFSESYFASGGIASLSDYYHTAYSGAVFHDFLRRRILFADHCLATDASFAEVQLVSCRNVLIYFGRSLQDRAIGLFRQSLCPRGFLGLGTKETLALSDHASAFEAVSRPERIFRLRGGSHGVG